MLFTVMKSSWLLAFFGFKAAFFSAACFSLIDLNPLSPQHYVCYSCVVYLDIPSNNNV